MNIATQIKEARRVSTPIIAVSTADQPATVASIAASFNGSAPPIIQWDLIRGLTAVNEAGEEALTRTVPPSDMPGIVPGQNPADALTLAADLPPRTLLFLHNAQRIVENDAVMQAICNLRDRFKVDRRTLVLLEDQVKLPPELQQDVMVIDEPLPDETELRTIVRRVDEAARAAKPDLPELTPEIEGRAAEALAGLAAFPAEQATALSYATKGAIDLDDLWARKCAFVSQTRGLSVDGSRETFDDLGGLSQAKLFGKLLFAGTAPPRCVVRIDEIEKAMAGASGPVGDTSGVSQDALGVLLRDMEDHEWTGLIAYGPPGSGKSAFSKTLGRTHGVPTFALDLGALKGSLVGQSEAQIRNAMKVIKAVAGKHAYFVATCNQLDSLKPELRRRFTDGVWFFDLPSAEERERIWTLNLARYGLAVDAERPDDDGWTGAEIRNCCRRAAELRISLREAAAFIVPVAKSDPQMIERVRKAAVANSYLSASYPGPYRLPAKTGTPSGARLMEVGA